MFNGHKNWNHWNVSLWINNTEELYNMARNLKRWHGATNAPQMMLDFLKTVHGDRTPDGAPYSVTTIRAAMRDM